MQYTNYAMKNNVFGTLSAPISSLATSIQLATGQGQRFTADMLATLESVEGNKVTKREIVKITNVTGDTLTVIRKFAPCPSSDDANTQGQVSYSFSADDTISVYITKEHFDKIDGSINDIYNNGTNKLRTEVISGLQIKVNPGSVLVGSAYYDFAGDTITLTDNATNYVEIDEDGNLVSNTTAWGDKNTKIAIVTTSSGAVTSIEDRRLGTVGGKIGGVNIHDLTEKETLNPEDEFIVSDSKNVWNNKKVKASNIIGYDNGVFMENINKGDIVSKKSMFIGKTDYTANVSDTTNCTKIGADFYGSGIEGNYIYLYLMKNGSPSGFTVRVETDNNGEPSGTLANANATGNIDTSSLTNTLALTKIDFNGNFTLTKGQKYWLVIGGTVDQSNYIGVGFANKKGLTCKMYNGNTWSDLGGSGTVSLNGGSGTVNASNTCGFNITPIVNVKLERFTYTSPYNINLTQIGIWEGPNNTGTLLYSGDGSNINLSLSSGQIYYISATASSQMFQRNSYTATYDIFNFSGQHWLDTNLLLKFDYSYDINGTQKIEIKSPLISSLIQKVDTSKIDTFDDIVGVALENGVEGDNKNIAVNGGIVSNDNRDLMPGQDYFFVNNAIQDTAGVDDTKIYLGKAISSNSIKVDIKIYIVLPGANDYSKVYTSPFNGLLISTTASGVNVKIDGTNFTPTAMPIMKGSTIAPYYDYMRLTKNR